MHSSLPPISGSNHRLDHWGVYPVRDDRGQGLGYPTQLPSYVSPFIHRPSWPVPLISIVAYLTGDAITRLRRLHALNPFAAFDDIGRAGLVPRRVPVRRGGLAYPVFRARRYPRHVLPV